MGEIRAISLSSFEPEQFKEFKPSGKNYVLNGKNNEGYEYVINRYRYSPTNASILDSYFSYIYGKGLTANYDASQATQMATVNKLFTKEVVRKIVKDFTLFHECSFEIILGKAGNEIAQINHLPKNKVVPSCVDEYGEINSYWYSYDWNDLRKYPATEIPKFEQGTKEKRTIFVIKEYSIDDFYFARPSYYSGLNYAELEEQISIYCINHIKNGLSAGHIINVNEGITDDEVKDAFERNIIKKWTGANNANKFILSFNSNKDNATTLESVTVSDAHQQYQFLTEEARKQLLTAHKVVSGAMLGIQTATGFSSNADEIETAFNETMLNVIKPLQETLTDGFEYVLGQNNITLQLFFESLRPKKVEETIVKMSEQKNNLDTTIAEELIKLGEEEDLNEWELMAECEVDYNNEYSFASTGSAFPNAKSEQDNADYMVRYQYAPLKVSENSREFCKKMVNAKKIYRKEDIIRMENQVVNAGWGPEGADTYSIWLYKGGGSCHHKWFRKIYVKKGVNVDVNSPLAELISTTKARQEGFNPPANDNLVSIAPKDMENNGFLN